MRIAIVGAGAMGCIFGSLLASGGHAVWLVDVWREHVQAISRDGLQMQRAGAWSTMRINATTEPAEVGTVDVALVAVKAYQTESAARVARDLLGPDGVALTMQNGVGNGEKIANVAGPHRVVAGVTGHGGRVLGPGCVAHTVTGANDVGWLDGPVTPELTRLAEAFRTAGLPTTVSDDVTALVWSKLVINVGVNAIAAVCRTRNVDVARVPEAWELAAEAIAEAVAVAQRKGIRLRWEDPLAHCRETYRANGEQHLSSMTLDVLRGRRTEIDALNGAVVDEGRRLGVPTPVNAVLTLLVRTIEQTVDRRATA
jgi:2-dehydropantoate 2-reductase